MKIRLNLTSKLMRMEIVIRNVRCRKKLVTAADQEPDRNQGQMESEVVQEVGGAYPRPGVREYWLFNLVDNVLEVFREPAAGGGPGSLGKRPLRGTKAAQVIE